MCIGCETWRSSFGLGALPGWPSSKPAAGPVVARRFDPAFINRALSKRGRRT